jgi:hypothetical protein
MHPWDAIWIRGLAAVGGGVDGGGKARRPAPMTAKS